MRWSQTASVLLGGFTHIAFKLTPTTTTPLQALTTVLLLPLVQAAYVLSDDYSGDAFFQNFNFFTEPDPTNGHVQFQSLKQANSSGIAGFMNGGNATKAIYLGVDTKSQAPQGRGSVRVQSQKSYQHALVIADIVHMPGGVCGTWPAFWMVGADWPVNGEIDIIEGVNDQNSNQMTLHTNAGVVISKQAPKQTAGSSKAAEVFTGSVLTANCDVNAADQSKNAGCAIADDSGLTFGADFNANGGGVVAMEWTSEAIKIWMFARGSFPMDISSSQPNPSAHWGPPTSLFAGNFSMDDHFKNLNIVFDTTFCGDWGGNTWNSTTSGSKCAALAPTCEQYVSENPAAFTEAYWAINTLQVFQDDGKNSTSASAAVLQQQVAGTAGADTDVGAGVGVGRFIRNTNPVIVIGGRNEEEQGQEDAQQESFEVLTTKGGWVQSQSHSQDDNQIGDRSAIREARRNRRKRNGGAVLPIS